MYLLINGRPPFYEKTKEATLDAIVHNEADFSCNRYFCKLLTLVPSWECVSSDAKSLASAMLIKDPTKRITANEALTHPWFRTGEGPEAGSSRNGRIIESLRNLINFKTYTTMQKAVLAYLASQQGQESIEERMREIFASLDTNKDGQLTDQELFEGFFKLHNNLTKAKRDTLAVLKRADVNMNGAIDYNEFIMANMHFKKMLSEQKLKRAFDFYDIVSAAAIFILTFIEQRWSNKLG